MYVSHARSVLSGVQGHPHMFHGYPWLTHRTDTERDQQAPVARRATYIQSHIATPRSFSMPSNRSHPSDSRAGVICSRRNSPLMTRPTYGLPSQVQGLLKPNNVPACQLRDPKGHHHANAGPSRSSKGSLMETYSPLRVKREPLRPTECHRQKRGPLGPKYGLSGPTQCC